MDKQRKQHDVQLIKNHSFQEASIGEGAPKGWKIKPENNTFCYQVEEASVNQITGNIQRVTGEGRGDGYIWQVFPVAGNTVYRISGCVKTEGQTTAQLWLLLLDGEGRVLRREESPHVLGETDWTTITMDCKAVPESREAMVFAINFTVRSRASALWDFVSVMELPAIEEKVIQKKRSGSDGDNFVIIPKPRECTLNPQAYFELNREVALIARDSHKETQSAASYFTKELAKREGLHLATYQADPKEKAIIFTKTEDPFLAKHRESYTIQIQEQSVEIKSSSKKGFYHAVQTLLQLLRKKEAAWLLPTGRIKDWPEIKVRGVHMPLDLQNPSFIETVVDKVIAPLKFNTLILECSNINWDSRKELWQMDVCGPSAVKRMVDAAHYHSIDVIPLIQSLGHCEWLFANNQNMDICEDPSTPYCYNPLKERTYKVMFEIMEEAIELFNPRMLHIGHDEVRMIGRFPFSDQGRQIGFETLFINDTNRISSFLLKRGITPMMWADVIQEKVFDDKLSRLNRHVMMVDWQYHPFRQYEGIRYLMENGFRTMGAAWHDKGNIETMASYIKKEQADGFLQTTWAGFQPAKTAFSKELHQFEAYYYAAEKSWNINGYPSLDELPYDPSEKFQHSFSSILKV